MLDNQGASIVLDTAPYVNQLPTLDIINKLVIKSIVAKVLYKQYDFNIVNINTYLSMVNMIQNKANDIYSMLLDYISQELYKYVTPTLFKYRTSTTWLEIADINDNLIAINILYKR